MTMVDKLIALVPIEYEVEQSPLVKELTADSNGQIDVDLSHDPTGPQLGN